MEASPNFNNPPIDPRDALIIAHIDATLAEYDEAHTLDHERVMQERNLADLQVMVTGGLLTSAEAEQRHYDWLVARGDSLI